MGVGAVHGMGFRLGTECAENLDSGSIHFWGPEGREAWLECAVCVHACWRRGDHRKPRLQKCVGGGYILQSPGRVLVFGFGL